MCTIVYLYPLGYTLGKSAVINHSSGIEAVLRLIIHLKFTQINPVHNWN